MYVYVYIYIYMYKYVHARSYTPKHGGHHQSGALKSRGLVPGIYQNEESDSPMRSTIKTVQNHLLMKLMRSFLYAYICTYVYVYMYIYTDACMYICSICKFR